MVCLHSSVIMLLKQLSLRLAPIVIGCTFNCCICSESAPSFVALEEPEGAAAYSATQESFFQPASGTHPSRPSHSPLPSIVRVGLANGDTSTPVTEATRSPVVTTLGNFQVSAAHLPQPRYSASSLSQPHTHRRSHRRHQSWIRRISQLVTSLTCVPTTIAPNARLRSAPASHVQIREIRRLLSRHRKRVVHPTRYASHSSCSALHLDIC
jgi:hypothetical protein